MKGIKSKLYCSLDIETSGFDPLKNEVLEVGFVLFEFVKRKVKIKKEYTRVFKPSGQVPLNILGLTGIKQEELDAADLFIDHKKELQGKLQDAVIVGHNVIFDIRFLESLGIKFSGEVVDTLDLVQFLLPTHHSYNLENLMHYFKVDHKDAHRALADAKACVVVLEKLMKKFGGFSPTLQKEILDIGATQKFAWADLLNQAVSHKVKAAEKKQRAVNLAISQVMASQFKLEDKVIYDFPVGTDCADYLAHALAEKKSAKGGVLLVVPKHSQVIKLWNSDFVEAVFPPELLFDETKFLALKNKINPTPEEAKFTLKVLVWQATNWQVECIFDLNLSFFGGQFKSYITGGKLKENKTASIVCCSLEALSAIADKGLYKNRRTIIVGLNEFENYISSSLSVKASWTYITYLLKTFYNPEVQSGNVKVKDLVIAALAKADLFFGLVSMLLKSDQQFQYFKIDENSLQSEALQKIQAAAQNFAALLLESNLILKSEAIAKFAESLQNFFSPEVNQVKWIELSPERCILQSAPVDISGAVKNILNNFSYVAFADSLGSDKLLGYFIARLGLAEFSPLKVGVTSAFVGQRELFRVETKAVICHLSSLMMTDAGLGPILAAGSLPAAVLFGNATQVKSYYEGHYKELQQTAFLVAQNSSGGSNKMFHNFIIHNNSLMLITGRTILKHLSSSSSIDPVERVAVKTLVIGHLPFEVFTHPYQEAVAARFGNAFEDYSLPRAIYNFHSLLEFFNTPTLEQIYIFDSKLAKDYGKVFREYLLNKPDIQLI